MAKLTLTDISTGYSSTSVINANNALIETALENTLSRDGTSPNQMNANLDMNSNKIVNVTDGTNNQDAVTLAQLNAASIVASTIAGTAVTIADANGYFTGTTAEGIFDEIGDPSEGALYGSTTPQTLTGAGAVNLTTSTTWIVTTGADALTLADGVEGQRKFIIMKTDGGDGTLTPTTLGNGTTITFDDVGDSANLLFTNSAWYFMGGTATLA